MDNKYMAHHLVTCAIRNGVLKPEPCLVCHRPCGRGKKKTHAHHENYGKPLEVVWLCSSCHRKVHLGLIMLKIYI